MCNRPKVVLSLLTSFVLVGSACGGSSSDGASSDGASPSGSEDSNGGDTEAAAEYESPLFEFLGFDTDFGSDESKAKQAQNNREGQEKVAACMRAEGFEYTPTDDAAFQVFVDGEEGLEYGSKAWVEKYGFGVTTQAFSQEQVGPDLVGHNFGDFFSTPDPSNDPNAAYVQSLPQGEQEAYYAALYGSDSGPEYDSSLSEEENEAIADEFYGADYEPTGCFSSAFVDNEFANVNAFFDEFQDEIEELQQRFEADPRVAEVRAKTKTCVADKGYVYTNQDDAFGDLQDRISDIGGGAGGGGVIISDGAGSGSDLTDEQIEQQFFEQNKLSDDDKTKLAAAQEHELGMALAVYECSGNSLDDTSNPELSKIRIQIEQEFLDTNQDRLAEFKGTAG